MSAMSLVGACLVFSILSFTDARVIFEYSQVLQAPDIAATNETNFECVNSCKVYVDRKSNDLVITSNGNIIVTFSMIISGNIYAPAGVSLSPGEYKLENKGELNPEFVFYVIDSQAPNYGAPVFVPQETIGIAFTSTSRYATFITSFEALSFSGFRGDFPEGYPRIYSTGFDAAGDIRCHPVYQARSQLNAELSKPIIMSAVLSVDFGFVGSHNVSVNRPQDSEAHLVGSSTVYNSPGYVGCSFNAGQNYYSSVPEVFDEFTISADSLDIDIEYSMLTSSEARDLLTVNGEGIEIAYSGAYQKHYDSGEYTLAMTFVRESELSSFAMQLDFGIPSPKTSLLPTTRTPTTKVPSTTKLPSTTTSTTEPPISQSSYCSCAVDKFGFQDGWDSNEIWLDVVFIIDTSEAMGADSIADASALLESIIGDGDYDVLITDPQSPFYTRIGVISMAKSAEVLYNLNMTKADTVSDKVNLAKGLANIDVMDAFAAARNMFADGLKTFPERENTRQVIYYLTNSDASVDTGLLSQFKQNGTIVVDHFVKKGAPQYPGLVKLASDGYYFDDIERNYLATIQVFCRANCFCPADRTAYRGVDATDSASGGCYYAREVGIPFDKAAKQCAENRGGLLASVHDSDKGKFLSNLITEATDRSYYFWIGYSKGNDGNWKWEDKSTDSYTNWDSNEPSTAAVAKCAYVDQNQDTLPWGAGNCQLGFPFVCESAPCSVGNKIC